MQKEAFRINTDMMKIQDEYPVKTGLCDGNASFRA